MFKFNTFAGLIEVGGMWLCENDGIDFVVFDGGGWDGSGDGGGGGGDGIVWLSCCCCCCCCFFPSFSFSFVSRTY